MSRPLLLPAHLPADLRTGVAATPVAFIQAIVSAYRRYGADPAQALGLAQIAPEMLENPALRVTALQMEVMSAVAMQELDDEALGWFSRRLPWGSYGLLCRASLSSPTLGVALKRWCRHHRLLTEDIMLRLEVAESAILSIDIRHDPGQTHWPENQYFGESTEFCLVTSLRYLLGYACWLIDSRIPLLEVCLPYPAPAHHADVYPLLFPCPVHFDSGQAAMRFDARYLELTPRRNEAELQTMLKRALPLTVLQYRRDRLLTQRISQLLYQQAGEPVTAAQLAAQLHVSCRTLFRHLNEEGTSLIQIKDKLRQERAMQLLGRSQRPIKQVAQAVGYRSEKSFARAFRQWTGLSPSEFREQGGVQALMGR